MKRIARREKERQIWADLNFACELEKIKAQRILIGKPIKSTGEITREITKMPSWNNLLKDLLNGSPKPRIKIDKKRWV